MGITQIKFSTIDEANNFVTTFNRFKSSDHKLLYGPVLVLSDFLVSVYADNNKADNTLDFTKKRKIESLHHIVNDMSIEGRSYCGIKMRKLREMGNTFSLAPYESIEFFWSNPNICPECKKVF